MIVFQAQSSNSGPTDINQLRATVKQKKFYDTFTDNGRAQSYVRQRTQGHQKHVQLHLGLINSLDAAQTDKECL